ncbi:MAG: hypothetical protein L6W00_22200 [Lentisphaeria bacterium]|nr:MAG: hypothetical protein L6W00_22200 [Lentisphaeria bacterium]
MKEYLNARDMEFSSANSINFGRLVPQIIYYVSAYCDLLGQGSCAGANGSTSQYPPEISATFLPQSTPGKWAFRSPG